MNYTQWFAQNGKFDKHEQWMVNNVILETIVGSHSYGCQTDKSDYDVMTLVLPKHEHLYPQNYGFIIDFDQLPNFKRKELKGKQKTIIGKQLVEAEWVSLIEFFVQAGLRSSPNLLECLFVKKELVTVGTKMGYYLRDNRRLFLSMKTYHAFRGYANNQMHKIRSRNPETDERKELVKKYGYDLKQAYHVLRLADQLEQILTLNDIDLMRNKEECKLMREGEWGDFDRFDAEFQKKMDYLNVLSRKCNLAPQPQHDRLKTLLNEILEEYYPVKGNITLKNDEYVSVKDINDKFNLILKKLK